MEPESPSKTEHRMYTLMIVALLLLPWVLVFYIAAGSLRDTRRAARQPTSARSENE